MGYPKEDEGKCLTCGFLARHTHVAPGYYAPLPRYYEVELEERQRGAYFYYHIEPSRPLDTEPACIKHAANLANELAAEIKRLVATAHTLEAKQSATRETAAINIVGDAQRCCEHWYPYSPGFSPKEHLEQKMYKQFEEELEQQRVSRDRLGIRLIIAALILGLFQLIAALFAMTPDSWFVQWMRPARSVTEPIQQPEAPEQESPPATQ